MSFGILGLIFSCMFHCNEFFYDPMTMFRFDIVNARHIKSSYLFGCDLVICGVGLYFSIMRKDE